MTTKELTEIVTKHDVTISEINHAIAQMTHNSLILHDSIKALEVIAEAHNEDIDKLTVEVRTLTREWQAYIKRLPSN